MGCVCRASSLRIFVQSLTGLEVAHRPVSRFALPLPLPSTSFATTRLPQTSSYLTRSFHAAASLRSSSPEVLEQQDDKNSAAGIISTSADDLERAKHEGAILDFSPESLDLLLNSSNDTSTGPEKSKQGKSQPPSSSEQQVQKKTHKKEMKVMEEEERKQPERPLPQREIWRLQKEALKEKFPEGWNPRKKLSPDAMEGMRALHQQFPQQYTLPVLAQQFEISPEAVRRILRSKWRPTPEEEEARQERWFERGKKIWTHKAALGVKPPRKWRREGIVRDPVWNVKRGPRTEWPYMPRHLSTPRPEDDGLKSPQEKLSENLV